MHTIIGYSVDRNIYLYTLSHWKCKVQYQKFILSSCLLADSIIFICLRSGLFLFENLDKFVDNES